MALASVAVSLLTVLLAAAVTGGGDCSCGGASSTDAGLLCLYLLGGVQLAAPCLLRHLVAAGISALA